VGVAAASIMGVNVIVGPSSSGISVGAGSTSATSSVLVGTGIESVVGLPVRADRVASASAGARVRVVAVVDVQSVEHGVDVESVVEKVDVAVESSPSSVMVTVTNTVSVSTASPASKVVVALAV